MVFSRDDMIRYAHIFWNALKRMFSCLTRRNSSEKFDAARTPVVACGAEEESPFCGTTTEEQNRSKRKVSS